MVLALLCFRVESNLTIEVNIGVSSVSVAVRIFNPDNHLAGAVILGKVFLLGKADEIAAPVVVVRRKVDMILAVPTQLPTLWSIEAHFRGIIGLVRVSLQDLLLMRSRERRKRVKAHDLPSSRTDRRKRRPRPNELNPSCVL